jgi:CRISPR/Cas system CMR subunit Cmr4 (Cas7 group RAMP superfamily)
MPLIKSQNGLKKKFDDSFLQIGGDETVGKGVVKLKVFNDSNRRDNKNEHS